MIEDRHGGEATLGMRGIGGGSDGFEVVDGGEGRGHGAEGRGEGHGPMEGLQRRSHVRGVEQGEEAVEGDAVPLGDGFEGEGWVEEIREDRGFLEGERGMARSGIDTVNVRLKSAVSSGFVWFLIGMPDFRCAAA